MKLSGLHILMTYQCTHECDHCFVWGSPWQTGVFSLDRLREVFQQSRALGTIRKMYFEGGEPFLYYAVLLAAVRTAVEMGFSVGIVSNAYWATSCEDALLCLAPFKGLLEDLTVSSDLYHSSDTSQVQAQNACAAAGVLGISSSTITIAQPGPECPGQGTLMLRGRASQKLSGRVQAQAWDQFTSCPYEDLRDPGRVHLDPFGNLHVCQGIVIGNLFEKNLDDICAGYNPEVHPVVGPLLEGGPCALITEYALPHEAAYGDACHLCYSARRMLRQRFPSDLRPDQMYGMGG